MAAGDIFNSKAGVARVDDRGFASEFAVQAMKGTPAVALAAWTMNDVGFAVNEAAVDLNAGDAVEIQFTSAGTGAALNELTAVIDVVPL